MTCSRHYYALRMARKDGYDNRTVCTRLHADEGHEKGRELWANPYLKEYEKAHGMHFNDKLAEYAGKKMENRNGVAHYWTKEEVKAAVESLGYRVPDYVYWCDLHYLANTAYADYFGSSLKTETDCLQWACDTVNDPDGYKEKAFNHYLADLMRCEHCNVPWRELT